MTIDHPTYRLGPDFNNKLDEFVKKFIKDGYEHFSEEFERINEFVEKARSDPNRDDNDLRRTDKEKYFSNVEVVGMEHAERAFKRGKGVINIVPHIGCWEAASKAYTLLGFPAGAVAKPFKNQMLNNWVMKNRSINGFKIFPRGSTYKTLLLHLKNNNSLGMLMDQDTSVKGVFVHFYGKRDVNAN